jgi:hypothetical protein
VPDGQGNTYTFGSDPTTTSPAPTASPNAGDVVTGTTASPNAQQMLYIEFGSDGVGTWVRFTPDQLQQALAQGRHVFTPTILQVSQLLQEGRLNSAEIPPEVVSELGRMQHADPTIGPVFTPAASSGTGGTPSGGPLDLSNLNLQTDPILQDASDWYYKLYGVVPPQGFVEKLKSQYENIYDIKAAILAQARKDSAPGLSTLPAAALSPEMQRLAPLVDAAGRYYFELYGKPPPAGEVEKMAQQGMSLFGIQRALLQGAKEANAPGFADVRFQQEVSSGQQLYFSLWGRDAPPQYIEKAVTSGLNLFELEKAERAKPAFMETKRAKDELAAAAGQLTNFLGMGY